MAWSTPRTWLAGELVTAALLNAHLRDQLVYLHDLHIRSGNQNTTFPGGSATSSTATIAHGLGVTPTSHVAVIQSTSAGLFAQAVAAPDATNLFVAALAPFSNPANGFTVKINWMAAA